MVQRNGRKGTAKRGGSRREMNKERNKKKNGETKGENVSWSWKIVAAIRCTGGKASRRRRSFVACGKLSLKDEEAGEEKEISACVYIGEVHRNRKLFESVRKRILLILLLDFRDDCKLGRTTM